MRAWQVVLGWGVVNAVLAGLLWTFEEHPLVVALYAGPALATVLAAILVRHTRRAPAGEEPQRLATTSASALLAALAVVLAALGLVYGYWLIVLAAVALVAAFARARRERLPPGVETAPTRVPSLHTTLPGQARELDGVAKGVRVAAVAAIGLRGLSAVRRLLRSRRP
ncbi:hypothetical protein [Saccharomonospora xinjiangensis]|uniref:Uncharacterized protein n=1 Tax=Saccharomonospora xinjiangensis XJ-54 TaxID=882086 RepID=I0V7E3_9PSEU|nr:hypothetical protein [Saccharomonospora xinjiangensis]EID56046.1 hypothetical protein SacxiDRAFT_3854 [Saccharomonospora xinjiangensis XJ-54]